MEVTVWGTRNLERHPTARYSLLYPSPHLEGRPVGFRGTSAWWRDISL
ncbi:hypothetical protein A2U01_0083384, partial [Trifolium medium]|nr:hypothetical protein [Trifolium medium]